MVEITNLSGQALFNDQIPGTSDQYKIDVSGFKPGVYFVKVTGKDFAEVEKVMIY